MRTRPRPRGPKPAPNGRLTAAFRHGVLTAGPAMNRLATAASFTRLSHLSTLLHADRVAMTPLVIERAKKLAAIIQFDGDLFEVLR